MAPNDTAAVRPLHLHEIRHLAVGGALAGLTAGLAMLAAAMALFYVAGQRLDVPLRIVSSTLAVDWALASGSRLLPALAGLGVHLALSVLFGTLFALMIGFSRGGKAIAWGLVFGLGVGLAMRLLLLPIANPLLALAPANAYLAVHAVFGVVLGTLPAFTRWSERRGNRAGASAGGR